MPCASRIGVPWRKRESGVTSSRSMPSADQSRCASSISLSDLEIQTARAAALQPVVEQDAGDLAAFAGAGAVAEHPAAAEANGVFGVVGAPPRRHRRSRPPSMRRRESRHALRPHR